MQPKLTNYQFLLELLKKQPTDNSCMEWPLRLGPGGYGTVRTPGTGYKRVHRVAWEVVNGPIPGGLYILHKCDNPACFRPDHLSMGTQADNMRDAIKKARFVYPPHGGIYGLQPGHKLGMATRFKPGHRISADERRGLSERWMGNTLGAKLTPEQVKQIRSLKGSHSQKGLAKLFGVCQSNIHNILAGKTWGHLL